MSFWWWEINMRHLVLMVKYLKPCTPAVTFKMSTFYSYNVLISSLWSLELRDVISINDTNRFLGVLAKLWKATISFIMYVFLSVHLHGSFRLPLDEFSWHFIFEIFRKSVKKIQARLKMTRITGTLHQYVRMFMIKPRSTIFRMNNI
jgi:hypothetical protein